MVSGSTALLLLPVILALAAASVCPPGKQFLNHQLQKCMNCTICDKHMVVLTPCEVHRDTHCGTLSNLNWDIMKIENPHRHRHHKHTHKRKELKTDSDGMAEGGGGLKGEQDGVTEGVVGVTNSEVPFSSVEALVWDWQAIALTLAVFACIVFFLVIAIYSLHQARQWRRLKENFEAGTALSSSDVEELSVRLSLMAANCQEKGEALGPTFATIRDINYLNSKCVYLEQLLNIRKDTKIGSEAAGNVYIEESNTPSSGKT